MSYINPFKIKSDYLTPIEYPHNFSTSFYFDIYYYNNARVLSKIGTVYGDILSGNITKDRSSEFLSSMTLEMVVSDTCEYKLSANYNWNNKVISLHKKYEFLNDRFYRDSENNDTFNAEDIGNDITNVDMGYFVVDSTTYKYDDSSRTLSFSGTDILSCFSSSHGGTLIDYNTWKYDIDGFQIPAGNDLYGTVNTLLDTFSPLEIENRFITISESETSSGMVVPYDLDFEAETSLYDMLKKVKDLYENRIMYMGNNFRFYMYILPRCWRMHYLNGYYTTALARHFTNLVISETVNVDHNDIVNYITVEGKSISTTNIATGEVTVQYPTGTYFINDNNNPFSVNTIGIRKKVMQSDNCLTDDDCYNKALWECYYNTEFRETTSIVISDNCVPLFLSTNGMTEAWSVGSCCEYTSIITGETNLYIINKVDHNLADGTYSIDMQRFRPLASEPTYIESSYPEGTSDSEKDPYDPNWGKYDIKTPVVSIDYGDNGLVTFTCNNEDYTEFTLFKFWQVKNGQEIFIGETCTEDENLNKVFNYKFEDNGTYTIKVGGYSPYYPPSAKSEVSVVISNIGV